MTDDPSRDPYIYCWVEPLNTIKETDATDVSYECHYRMQVDSRSNVIALNKIQYLTKF